MGKEHAGRELWERMGKFVESDDGLPVYECGPWTVEKLFFLCQYLATTTRAMVGHSKFRSVNYVDLFASNGVCVVKGETGRGRRYAGSALLAGGCKKRFDNLLLVEKEKSSADALRQRMARLGCTSNTYIWNADANLCVDELVRRIPDDSLTVAFIDPYSLGIHFDTVQKLAGSRPLDLLILFADAMDITRNVHEYYASGRSEKLDRFLGKNSNWRVAWEQLADRSGSKCREFFANTYLAQLRRLGYRHTRVRPIRSDIGQLYSLVYASRNPLGLKFWDIACNEKLEGTKGLWGL